MTQASQYPTLDSIAYAHGTPLRLTAGPEAIAAAYDAAPVKPGAGWQEELRARDLHDAFGALNAYVYARWNEALHDGWTFVRSMDASAPDLTEAWQTRTLRVYDGDHGHPYLTAGENYRFRAVHDVFGHMGAGLRPFGYAGEVAAAQQQARDIYRWSVGKLARREAHLAVAAMLTEVIGQAACFEVHGRFPVQKGALIISPDADIWPAVELAQFEQSAE